MEQSKISNIEWGLVIGVALLIDGVQVFLGMIFIGTILNRFISICAWIGFYLWLKLKGVKRFGKWLIGGGVGESIPVLGMLPFWTLAIVAIMIQEKVKKKIKPTKKVKLVSRMA